MNTGQHTRQMTELGRAEALRLLGSVELGRIVFTADALPAIRPVNHILDDGDVIIRSHTGAALTSSINAVVAYEADDIDPDTHIGWSVVVTGIARKVTDPDAIARYEQLLTPWADQHMDQVLRIHPEFITGFTLTDGTVGR
ncbi:pyridoxamine 5'-phosphate oxidase family protein [Amycolatopsis alkalitolerans]|uniref:Pyridoxamine 5'-phosphate oxidase family protein n=1 Tax=Amycolatopsis alkalitolerans TaxID=2547244 RepID=A0A5C4M5F0_9PSEU|nr:pyridoxamine 5'-phosphate oxidase family protein [Amycolatopsis alkalitolerans]TNC28035.1 pyridoxamine 5'-phosphate oxidase family protein [Amycolatopsis alkalitolerans]